MKATREQVLAMAGLAKGRLMHEQNQHELICFAEDDLEAFAHKLQQFTLDQLRAQGANLGFGCIARIPETLE